jgi:hypothetical protein
MRSTRKANLARALAAFLPAVLMLAIPLGAQTAAESHPAPGFGAAYDVAHEITFNGTVQEVVTKHTVGSPIGMHLIVSGTQGTVDASVGYRLSANVREALHQGLPIQIVGMMGTLNGKQYLTARLLMFGGQTVTVRNRNGFLVGNVGPARANDPRAQRAAAQMANGGAQ